MAFLVRRRQQSALSLVERERALGLLLDSDPVEREPPVPVGAVPAFPAPAVVEPPPLIIVDVLRPGAELPPEPSPEVQIAASQARAERAVLVDALWSWAAASDFARLQITAWSAVVGGLDGWRRFCGGADVPDLERAWVAVQVLETPVEQTA